MTSPAATAALDQARATVHEITATLEWQMAATYAPELANHVMLASLLSAATEGMVPLLALCVEWNRYLSPGP